MSTVVATPKPLTGGKVLAMLIAFFGIIIGVNTLMMRLAIGTLPGTEVDSPYVAGLSYGQEIAAARLQAARHWQVSAHVARMSGGGSSVRVEARDAEDRPLTGLTFSARLERPTDKRADITVALTESGRGIYEGAAAAVPAGQWDLVTAGESHGQRVFVSKNRVILN